MMNIDDMLDICPIYPGVPRGEPEPGEWPEVPVPLGAAGGKLGGFPDSPRKSSFASNMAPYGTQIYSKKHQKTKVARVDLGQPSLGQPSTLW